MTELIDGLNDWAKWAKVQQKLAVAKNENELEHKEVKNKFFMEISIQASNI